MRHKRKQNKACRRAEAIARQEARDQRSDKEQLDLIRGRSGESVKETTRLIGRLWDNTKRDLRNAVAKRSTGGAK